MLRTLVLAALCLMAALVARPAAAADEHPLLYIGASNATAEGRLQNRRVEFTLIEADARGACPAKGK